MRLPRNCEYLLDFWRAAEKLKWGPILRDPSVLTDLRPASQIYNWISRLLEMIAVESEK